MDFCKVFGSIKLVQQHTRNSKGNFQCSQQPLPTLVVSVHGEHSQSQPTQFQLKQQLACTKTKKGGGKEGGGKKKNKERGSFSFCNSFPSCETTDEPVLINPSLSAAGRHRAASLVCQHRCSLRARNKPNQGNGLWQPGTTGSQGKAPRETLSCRGQILQKSFQQIPTKPKDDRHTKTSPPS